MNLLCISKSINDSEKLVKRKVRKSKIAQKVGHSDDEGVKKIVVFVTLIFYCLSFSIRSEC